MASKKITNLPKNGNYEAWLTEAAWYAMDLLEEDDELTLDYAVKKVIAEAEWIRTEAGVTLILTKSVSVERESKIPEGKLGEYKAAAVARVDLRHELVECGIDPEVFA